MTLSHEFEFARNMASSHEFWIRKNAGIFTWVSIRKKAGIFTRVSIRKNAGVFAWVWIREKYGVFAWVLNSQERWHLRMSFEFARTLVNLNSQQLEVLCTNSRTSCSFLAWLIHRSWTWKRDVTPKSLLTSNGLHGVNARRYNYSMKPFTSTISGHNTR
jgi:hypothetical protein